MCRLFQRGRAAVTSMYAPVDMPHLQPGGAHCSLPYAPIKLPRVDASVCLRATEGQQQVHGGDNSQELEASNRTAVPKWPVSSRHGATQSCQSLWAPGRQWQVHTVLWVAH